MYTEYYTPKTSYYSTSSINTMITFFNLVFIFYYVSNDMISLNEYISIEKK